MLRALIAAALLTGAAVRLFGLPTDAALGYGFVLCLTIWFTWPALRCTARLISNARHSRRSSTTTTPGPAPQLTQINHHHYYYGPPPPMTLRSPQRPDHPLPGLPQRTCQQKAHDAIYDIIDHNDIGP